ncbi:hypothetical protein Leryth_019632 [Lithospermum erythrorhizon]|nr:hypothetical protein Leryth_019632 [Lithospermum erythrorhizon]
MSLVRPATAFDSHKLHPLNGNRGSAGLTTAIFNSDKHGVVYGSESCSSEDYDPKYFLNSPSEEVAQTSSSDCLRSPFYRPDPTSYQVVVGEYSPESSLEALLHSDGPNYESKYLDIPSPASVEYDQNKMNMKLQELERALLGDNDDDCEQNESMDMDDCEPIRHLVLHDSPKESTSSDSNISSINSCKDITMNQTPKQLLFYCASAIQEGRVVEASKIINELRQKVSIEGDPHERIAAYMVEALAARMATSGKGLYGALRCKQPPSSERLSAMQVLFEVCPCFRFGFMAANGAILDAFKGERRVHIIDFDINQGSQYYSLLRTLAALPGKPPLLKLTGVDDPESVQRTVGGLNLIGQRLKLLAEDLHIQFSFQALPAETAVITPSMLKLEPGEAIIVNFAFQLHHMPDESVSTVNERDQLLRMVKSLNPKLVTVVEQDMNTNTAPFLPRFAEAYDYYSAVFETLEATLPRDSQDRMNVERQCLARDIINIVACEGVERIERYEVAGKWRARMMMAGFTPCLISRNVKDTIQELIKQYSKRFQMKEGTGDLHFGWEDRTLIVTSAWM